MDKEIYNILEDVMTKSYLLLGDKIINKFSYKTDIVNNNLQISIRIPKKYSNEFRGYEYIPLLTRYKNNSNTLSVLDNYINIINKEFITRMASKYSNYSFIENKTEIINIRK